MRQQKQDIDFVMKNVSVRIQKSPDELEPFFKMQIIPNIRLKDNWYDSKQALIKLTLDDYQRMKIPHRIAQAICEQLQANATQHQSSSKSTVPELVLSQHTMIGLSRTLSKDLMANLQDNRYETRSVIEIIYKLIANIVKDPYEMKFRVLKKSNNLIQKNIIQHSPCLQFMLSIGFKDCGDTLQMIKFDVPQLIFLEDCINQLIVQLGGTTMQQQQMQPQRKEENMFLDVTKFPTNESDIKEQFSEQKLAEVRYFDALEKLIQFRNKIMSQAPQNRRIRIYHKRHEERNVQIQQISFQEEFQKTDDKVIASYWKQILSNNNRSQKFQSKRKLEFQFLIKQKIHKQTLIKVKLPNDFIIEAHFAPMEKLESVFLLVAKIVIGDLYMFTAPPKKIMDKKEMNKTLLEHDAVPTGSFYLASNQPFYIEKKYEQQIQK